jgi:hypothetical protein
MLQCHIAYYESHTMTPVLELRTSRSDTSAKPPELWTSFIKRNVSSSENINYNLWFRMNRVLQCNYTNKSSSVILFSIFSKEKVKSETTQLIKFNTMLQGLSWRAQSMKWPRNCSLSCNQKFYCCIHKIPPLPSVLYPIIDCIPYLCSRYFNILVKLSCLCRF